MKMILTTLLATCVFALPAVPAAAEEKPTAKAKVLLIGKQPDHPYGSHMYLHTCRMLGECLRLNGLDSTVSDGWPKDPTVLKEVKSIVVYTTPAAEYLLDAPHRDEVIQLMKRVTTKGQEVVVGWAFERPDGGRSYGTTLGHFYSNFEREPFRRTIVNAILWASKMDVPDKGARVDVGDDVLKLPPEGK